MPRSRTADTAARKGSLITVVSASGGTGKSTLALLTANLACRRSIKTALIEADLQFGDYGFWLGLDVDSSSLAEGLHCSPIALSDHLDLFKAPPLPEIAEEISDDVASLVYGLQATYELIVADTGQFWSGLTGELIGESDLIMIVMDQRESSIYSAIKALDLCQRFGVPAARIVCISNKVPNKSRASISRICTALGVEEVFAFADGKAACEALVSTGCIEDLIESDSAPVPDLRNTLACLLPRIGLEFENCDAPRRRRLFS